MLNFKRKKRDDDDDREVDLAMTVVKKRKKTKKKKDLCSTVFLEEFEKSSLESFTMGKVKVLVTNAVGRCFVGVESPLGELIPSVVLSESIMLGVRDLVQFHPKNSKFCNMSITFEWTGVLKGAKHIIYATGRIQSPGNLSDLKTIFNTHLFAKRMTEITQTPILPYGMQMTNHVCAFRVSWNLDLEKIRRELCGLQSNKADTSRKEFPAEMVRPYKHYPPDHRLKSVLVMFFRKGSVNIIGIRNKSDYETVALVALKICEDYRFDAKDDMEIVPYENIEDIVTESFFNFV